jgi:C2 domain
VTARSRLPSVLRLRPSLLVFITGVGISSGCVVRVGDKDSGDGPDKDATGETLDVCERRLESSTAAESQAAFESAIAQLEVEGVSMADIWSSESLILRFRALSMRAAGCDLSDDAAGVVMQELHLGNGGDNYCGPEHGRHLPAVSVCLNATCAQHDACYARCSEETSLTCMWNRVTMECDDDFFAAARTCEHTSHWFMSQGVLFLASGLRDIGPRVGCEEGMVCPGAGVCTTARLGAECISCLEQQDPNGACQRRSCGEEADDECYLANCPQVGGCFGGYTTLRDEPTAEGGAGGASSHENDPSGAGGAHGEEHAPSGAWSLRFLDGEVAATKSDGLPWDEAPFGPPDPFMVVTFGDATTHISSSPEDTNSPDWSSDAAITLPAETLLQPFTVEMWDEDVLDHDRVGACSLKLSAADFSGSVRRFDCPGADGPVFTVRYRLDSI